MGICITYNYCNYNNNLLNTSNEDINQDEEIRSKLFYKRGKSYIKIKSMKKRLDGINNSTISTESFLRTKTFSRLTPFHINNNHQNNTLITINQTNIQKNNLSSFANALQERKKSMKEKKNKEKITIVIEKVQDKEKEIKKENENEESSCSNKENENNINNKKDDNKLSIINNSELPFSKCKTDLDLLKLTEKNQKEEDEQNNMKYELIEELPESTQFSPEDDIHLIKELKHHFLFENLSDKIITELVENSTRLQLEENMIIFKEGEEANSFYVLKKGKIKLFDNKNTKYLNGNEFFSFGEMGLNNYSIRRKYSAITQSNVELYIFDKELFNTKREKNKEEDEKKEIIFKSFFDKEDIFLGINESEKKSFIELSNLKIVNEDKTVISLKEYNINIISQFYFEKFFFICKGNVKIINRQKNKKSIQEFISEKNSYGLSNLLFKSNIKRANTSISNSNQEDTNLICNSKYNEFIFFNEKMFIECFGLNYKHYLINSCILYYINNDPIFKKLINFCNISNEFVHEIFYKKYYKQNSLIFQKGISLENKSIILLDGKLTGYKNKTKQEKAKILFNGKNLFTFSEFNDDIITIDDTIVLETSFDYFQQFLTTKHLNTQSMIIFYNILNHFQIFQKIQIEQAMDIVRHINIKKYKQDNLIKKIGENCEEIYLIETGTVAVYNNSNVLRKVLESGNSFGSFYILNEQTYSYNYVAYSKEVVLYIIDKDYFMELLTENSINEYIREQLYLEDNNITLNDLYYLSYLGRGRFGNVCLVHNEIFFYAIKAISLSFIESQKYGVKYLLFEKNALIHIDHPFLLKLITTLKNETSIFFLMEYISGMNLGEYLNQRKIKRNIYESKFYSASLLLSINYLHINKIIHRDIKPSNIMLDKKGYIKIIDFGTAKILNENEKTKTVIGTPNFLPPEVLLGKGYSFSCDYWSIGVCIYYIYYGILPFGNNSTEINDTYKEIIEKNISFPDNNNIEINSLLTSLLDKNENNRKKFLDFKNIKNHVFFKNINWDALLSYKLKPPFVPSKDQRIHDSILNNITSPYVAFMKNEKNDSKISVSLKSDNQKHNLKDNFENPENWYENF